jgi:hypothetical protein
VRRGEVAVPGKGRDRRSSDNLAVGPSYATQAAETLGVNRRTVERDLARGKKIAPDILAHVTDSALDKGVVLDGRTGSVATIARSAEGVRWSVAAMREFRFRILVASMVLAAVSAIALNGCTPAGGSGEAASKAAREALADLESASSSAAAPISDADKAAFRSYRADVQAVVLSCKIHAALVMRTVANGGSAQDNYNNATEGESDCESVALALFDQKFPDIHDDGLRDRLASAAHDCSTSAFAMKEAFELLAKTVDDMAAGQGLRPSSAAASRSYLSEADDDQAECVKAMNDIGQTIGVEPMALQLDPLHRDNDAAGARVAANLAQAPPTAGPAAAPTSPPPAAQPVSPPRVSAGTATAVRLSCTQDGARSFNPIPGSEHISFVVDVARACINGKSPYERTANGFTRVMAADDTRVIADIRLSPDLTTYVQDRYALAPEKFARFRTIYGSPVVPHCDPAGFGMIAQERAAATAFMTGQPTRRLTWICARIGG